MSDELKPCPFCGLEISLIAIFGDTSHKRIGVHPPSVTCILANTSLVAEKWEGWNLRTTSSNEALLREALGKCRERFQEYEHHHMTEAEAQDQLARRSAGQPPTGEDNPTVAFRLTKARRNREMVEMIDAVLNTVDEPPGTGDA